LGVRGGLDPALIVAILTSLIHGNLISMHPLTSFTNASANTQLGQVYRDGHVYHGIKLQEAFESGKLMTFLIANQCLSKL